MKHLHTKQIKEFIAYFYLSKNKKSTKLLRNWLNFISTNIWFWLERGPILRLFFLVPQVSCYSPEMGMLLGLINQNYDLFQCFNIFFKFFRNFILKYFQIVWNFKFLGFRFLRFYCTYEGCFFSQLSIGVLSKPEMFWLTK